MYTALHYFTFKYMGLNCGIVFLRKKINHLKFWNFILRIKISFLQRMVKVDEFFTLAGNEITDTMMFLLPYSSKQTCVLKH